MFGVVKVTNVLVFHSLQINVNSILPLSDSRYHHSSQSKLIHAYISQWRLYLHQSRFHRYQSALIFSLVGVSACSSSVAACCRPRPSSLPPPLPPPPPPPPPLATATRASSSFSPMRESAWEQLRYPSAPNQLSIRVFSILLFHSMYHSV